MGSFAFRGDFRTVRQKRTVALLASLILALTLVGTPALGQAGAAGKKAPEKLAPFVPSSETVVERMLKLAEVKPGDVVYDLGSGDGRILIMAAQKFGAHAIGVELNNELHKEAAERIRQLKLEDRVRVIHGDLMQVDLSPATVVTLYLLTSANEKLKPRLEKYLRKGARIVSHDFEVPGWRAEKVENIGEDQGDFHQHTLYLYRR